MMDIQQIFTESMNRKRNKQLKFYRGHIRVRIVWCYCVQKENGYKKQWYIPLCQNCRNLKEGETGKKTDEK